MAGSESLTDLSSYKCVTFLYVCIFFKNSHTLSTFFPVNIRHGFSLPKPCLNKVVQRNPPTVSQILLVWASQVAPWKEFTCNAGDSDSIPGSGRAPGGENGNPLQYSCLGDPTEEEPVRYSPRGCRELDTIY